MRMIFRREAKQSRKQSRRQKLQAVLSLAVMAAAIPGAQGQAINANNWGSLTAPVYGTSQSGTYAGAELFAGPNQFDGNYFHGVIPNGKVVRPAGVSIQIGENPLGVAITPDSRYVITSSNDERNGNVASYQSAPIKGGYALSVVDSTTQKVVSHIVVGPLFIGLQVKASGSGYTVYASGGASNNIQLYNVSTSGVISAGSPASIPILPLLPMNAGYASNYVLDPSSTFAQNALTNKNTIPTATGNTGPNNFAPAISGVGNGFRVTFPAGSALSPDGRYLYVACNGDNSLAIIDTTTNTVLPNRIPVGYFPYGVTVSPDGTKVLVSNTGIQEYKFLNASYNSTVGDPNFGKLNGLTGITPGADVSSLFYVPDSGNGNVSTSGSNPRTSSVTVISVPGGNASQATLAGALYEGHTLAASDTLGDAGNSVGDTHPTATAIVTKGAVQVEYVAKSNSDGLALILVRNNRRLPDVNLSPLNLNIAGGHLVHGTYPNALAVSPDNTRLYVAEAGLNSVAVLDTTTPTAPTLLGRIPTGWYPSGVTVSPDGQNLYITNAKGVGEDINPAIDTTAAHKPTGVESDQNSNFIFGTLQQVPTASLTPSMLAQGSTAVTANNYTVNTPADTTIVPAGGTASAKIKHVIFILHENKTFDSMLGNLTSHFGPFATTIYNKANGTATDDVEFGLSGGFTQLALNTQALALKFPTAVNYFSDSEESDAGHQFSASGTASDYTEKTLLVKTGRGLLVNKNFEPEDYPEGGYIFNNAARNGVSFKDYGALIRIDGTSNGFSNPSTVDDPGSGKNGYSSAPGTNPVTQVPNSDVTSPTVGLGQSYFLKNPILAVLGGANPNGEVRIDKNYPGYNFDISDQRRAREFIQDFDRMVKTGTLPTFLYIYEPNDHVGTGANAISSPNIPAATVTGAMEIADGDTGLGMVVQHIMTSPIYYTPPTTIGGTDDTGSAIFITYDDAQSGHDHIDPHRTPMIMVSPFARLNQDGSGYVAPRHYVTASIVKTEELLMGLPPNNYGDLFATDLRDMFQDTYNGVTAANVNFNVNFQYVATVPGRNVWKLASKLDSSAPDIDSYRLGRMASLSLAADNLYRDAVKKHHLHTAGYLAMQAKIYRAALHLVGAPAPRDTDG